MFREAALERLSTPERLDQGLTAVGNASWTLLARLTALVIRGLIWSVLVVVPVTVKGEGILLSPGGVLGLSSDSPGRVTQFLVQTGGAIKVGQVVAQLDQPVLRQQMAKAMAQKRQALDDNITFLVRNIDLLEQRVRVEDDLLGKGSTTQDKVLQGKIDLGHQ